MARMGSYCRAYHARDLAAFPGWRPDLAQLRPVAGTEGPARDALNGDDLLYLQDDFTVTDGIFRDENVVFADAGEAWRAFCTGPLGFAPPAAVDAESAESAGSAASVESAESAAVDGASAESAESTESTGSAQSEARAGNAAGA